MRCGLVLLASGTIMVGAAPALAQYVPVQAPPGVQPLPPAPGAALRGYLTALADNPQNLEALIGAGRAALDMGDAEAALNFFSRADQVSPRNPRVKAGMASTLAELGQPQPALRLFADALALGAPEAEVQADRGTAYDMAGDPRRAQQDYLAVLRRRDDPEVRRNLALSLAISGQREAALHLIDPQLRRNERSAWRTQAFVLALTGDTLGATRTVQAMMPAGAQEMAPFLARLHGLSPAEKAMAVHLGRFPASGRTQLAHVDVSADPAALAFALGRSQPAATARPAPVTTRTTTTRDPTRTASNVRRTTPRRAETRVGSSLDPHGSFSTTRTPARPAPARPVLDSSDPYGLRGPAQVRTQPQTVPPQAARTDTPAPRVEPSRPQVAGQTTRWAGAPYPNAGQPAIVALQPPVAVQPSPSAIQPSALAQVTAAQSSAPTQVASTETSVAPEPPPSSAATTITPPSTITEVALPPAAPPAVTMAQPEPAAASASSLSDIAEVVNALPDEPQRAAPASSPPVRVAIATPPAHPTASRTTEPRTARTRTPAPPPNPSRHWVQIATGAERSALPREYARLKALAPDQLGRRAAYTAPLRATNRLLVGPFASDEEAQAFVNQLRRHNVSAFAWTSAAGQEIERLQTR